MSTKARKIGQDGPVARAVPAVNARSGATRSGMPLSLNRAPAPDLDPWIARVVISRIDTRPGFEIECGLCSDLAFQRVIIDGQWQDLRGEEPVAYARDSLLVGPQSRYFKLRCEGPILTVGIGFRPGALRALFGRDMTELIDNIERGDPLGLIGEGENFGFPPGGSPIEWAKIAEDRVRAFIAANDPPTPDSACRAFEIASFADPNIGPGDFAREHGINQRRLERLVKRDFGLTPRFVLRRARALDLAAQLLGIADEEDEAEFLLRYFDQAHLIREFQTFFGATPKAFRKETHLLMRMNLEARAARRLEELGRLEPGTKRPWAMD